MTLIENAAHLILLADPNDRECDTDAACTDRTHEAVDRVCTTCETPRLHLPSMETVAYCLCEAPDVWKGSDIIDGGPGILLWQCQRCGLPNLDVLRGRLTRSNPGGTIPTPCH